MIYQYSFNLMMDHLEKTGTYYYDLPDQVKQTLFEADGATGTYDGRSSMVLVSVKPLFADECFRYTLPVPLDACRPCIGEIWEGDHYEKVHDRRGKHVRLS